MATGQWCWVLRESSRSPNFDLRKSMTSGVTCTGAPVLLERVASPGSLYTDGRPHHRLQHLQVCHRRLVPRTSRRGDIFHPRYRPRGVRGHVASDVSKHRKSRWNALSRGTFLGFFGKNFSRNARRTSLRFLSSPKFKMIQLPSSWLNGEF